MSAMKCETTFEDQIATRIWLGLLDTDRAHLYFVSISSKMRKISYWTNIGITFGASGAFATTVSGLLPPVVATVINLLVALVAIWSRISGHAEKAATAAGVAKECDALGREWRRLWAEMSRMDGDEILQRCEDLERRASDIVDVVPREIPLDETLNQECAEKAYATIQHEYATS